MGKYGIITVNGAKAIDGMCALFIAGGDEGLSQSEIDAGVGTKKMAGAGMAACQLAVIAPLVKICEKLKVTKHTDPDNNGVYISVDGETLYDFYEFLDKLADRFNPEYVI
jgi:hypothetical protein